MLKRLAAALILAALPAGAQENPLAEYRWVARPVIVFADSPLDPRVVEQMAEFERAQRDLEERDVVVILDTEPDSALRSEFRPRDFQLLLIDKNGDVAYRKPDPVPIRELTRVIDRIPLRMDELRAQRAERRLELEQGVGVAPLN